MSRGPGRLESRIRLELARRPDGTPLRVLAGIAYGTGPAALTTSQLTAARQALRRLAKRGEIIAGPGPGGAKLWRTSAAAEDDAARRAAEDDAARAGARERAKRAYKRREERWQRRYRQWQQRDAQQSPPGAADSGRQAVLDRAAKLMGMLGSDHAGERDAAATALERLRRQHKLDWRDFLAAAPPWHGSKS